MIQLLILGGLIIVGILVLNFVLEVAGIIITIGSWMVIGYLAGQLIRGRGFGPIGDVALGITGGIVGSIVLRLVGLKEVTSVWIIGGILSGVVGAVVLIYLVRFFHDKDFAK